MEPLLILEKNCLKTGCSTPFLLLSGGSWYIDPSPKVGKTNFYALFSGGVPTILHNIEKNLIKQKMYKTCKDTHWYVSWWHISTYIENVKTYKGGR